MSRARTLIRNIGWNFAGQGLAVVAGVLLLPRLVRGLGPAPYALYALIGILGGYSTLLTFGTGAGTVRAVSEARGSRNPRRLEEALGFTFWVHAAGGAVGALALWLGRGLLAGRVFQVPPALAGQAGKAFAAAAVAAPALCLLQWCCSVLQGLHRFGAANVFLTLDGVLPLAGSVAVLAVGGGLSAVAVWVPACLGTLAMIACLTVWRALAGEPGPDGRVPRPALAWRQDVALFSFHTFLSQLGWACAFQFDKTVLGHLAPIEEMAYYLVPFTLAQSAHMTFVSVTGAVFPMVSELNALGRAEDIRRTYLLATRLILWLAMPAFLFGFILAPNVLGLWMGGEFAARGGVVLRLLLAAHLVYLVDGMPGTVCAGLGRAEVPNALMTANAVGCAAAWLVLVPRFGAAGAGAGLLVSLAVVSPFFVGLVNEKLVGVGWRDYLWQCWRGPALAAAALSAVVVPLRSEAWGWAGLAMVTVVGLAAYLVLTPVVWSEAERAFLLEKWRARAH